MTVTLEHITERFSLKTALDSVSLKFEGGKIHAVVGENGAGKSTLAAILVGDRQPTSGTILLDSSPVVLKTPRQAAEYGIMQVHQRPLLAGCISVRDNILLGTEHTLDRSNGKPVPKRTILARLAVYADLWAPRLDMKALVNNLGGDQRFFTAILSALCRDPSVLVLDEPSASLNWEQRRLLYANLRSLAQSGLNIIIITHSMREAELYTDTVTVLNRGIVTARYPRSADFVPGSPGYVDFPEENRKATTWKAPAEHTTARGAVSFQNVTVRPVDRPALFSISFTARDRELTLIRGLQESGLGTLENVVTGMETTRSTGTFTIYHTHGGTVPESYTTSLFRHPLTPSVLRNCLHAGVAIIPSNRTFRGSNPQLTVAQILTVHYTGRNPTAYARELILKAGISISPDEPASSLSGGMLQRLILTRELDIKPDFIILCEPLQGLDSVSSTSLCGHLYALAQNGAAVIVLSAAGFPEEICSNIYILRDGKLEQTGGEHT